MQYSCSAQPELLKDMYILHALATKTESRPESFPIHFPIGGRHKSVYHMPVSTLLWREGDGGGRGQEREAGAKKMRLCTCTCIKFAIVHVYTCTVHVHVVILKAGCHPVAIAQVVEH